jgi:hypothetical protein
VQTVLLEHVRQFEGHTIAHVDPLRMYPFEQEVHNVLELQDKHPVGHAEHAAVLVK